MQPAACTGHPIAQRKCGAFTGQVHAQGIRQHEGSVVPVQERRVRGMLMHAQGIREREGSVVLVHGIGKQGNARLCIGRSLT